MSPWVARTCAAPYCKLIEIRYARGFGRDGYCSDRCRIRGLQARVTELEMKIARLERDGHPGHREDMGR